MPHPRLLICKSAIEANLRTLINESGGRKAFPVLKANAYGLGIKEVLLSLKNFSVDEVPYICVARLAELDFALPLADGRTVLLLSEWPSDLAKISESVTVTAASIEDLHKLANVTAPRNFQIKINSGMNRLGLRLDQGDVDLTRETFGALFKLIKNQGHRLTGIFSHLACGEANPLAFSLMQSEIFARGVTELESLWGEPVHWKHLANSPATLRHVGNELSFINAFRPGIHLFGIQDPESNIKIRSVLKLRAPLRQLYWVEPGETIGYGRKFRAERRTRVGILNLGYADGLRRDSWNKGLAFSFEGERAPLLGVVSMDMCAVDCTEIMNTELHVGAEFEWIGTQQSIETIAAELGTVPYEVLTGLATRLERVFE